MFQLLGELPEGLVSDLSDSEQWCRLACFGCLRTEGSVACCPNIEPAVLHTNARGSKGLWASKRKHANLSNGEISYTCPDKIHPQIRLERHMESLQADGWNSSPVWSQSIKTWRGGCFFKMHKSQQKKKKMRHIKRQGNIAQSKKHNKSPENDPKEIDLWIT